MFTGIFSTIITITNCYLGSPDCGSEQGNSYLQLDLMTDSRFRDTYRSRHGRFKDRNNNAERVFLERPPAGRYVVKVSSYSLNEGPQPFALVVNFQRSSGMNYTSCPEVTYLACDSYLEDATVTVELVLNHPEFSASRSAPAVHALPGGRTAARDGSQPQLRRLLAARELHALH